MQGDHSGRLVRVNPRGQGDDLQGGFFLIIGAFEEQTEPEKEKKEEAWRGQRSDLFERGDPPRVIRLLGLTRNHQAASRVRLDVNLMNPRGQQSQMGPLQQRTRGKKLKKFLD